MQGGEVRFCAIYGTDAMFLGLFGDLECLESEPKAAGLTLIKGLVCAESVEGQMSSVTMRPSPVFSPVLTAMTRHSSSASSAFQT